MVVATIAFTLSAFAFASLCPAQDGAVTTGRVEGVVLGPSGDPMIGIEVVAVEFNEFDKPLARTLTDGQGIFVLGRIPMGRPIWMLAKAPGLTVASDAVRLTDDRPIEIGFLRFWESASVRGRVVDGDGQPVVDAEVLGTKDGVANLDGQYLKPETRTDQNGSFQLEGIPVGKYAIRVRADGYAMLEHEGYNLDEEVVQLQLKRNGGIRVSVRVTGLPRDLEEPPSVRLSTTRNGEGIGVPSSLSTLTLDRDGSLEVEGLSDDRWRAAITAPGWVFRQAEYPRDDAPQRLEFAALAEDSFVLRGTLRSSEGLSLSGETLVCGTVSSVTDEQGRFAIQAPLSVGQQFSIWLARSRWVLRQEKVEGHAGLHSDRYLSRYEGVVERGMELELEAVKGASVSGRLIDSDGQPVPYQSVELHTYKPNRMPAWSAIARTFSTRTGEFQFNGFHQQWDSIRIHSDGRRGGGSSELRLDSGHLIDDVVVRIEKSGGVEGRVTDQNKNPAIGVLVVLRNYDVETGRQTDGGWTRVLTDRKGRFRFIGVPPGGHRVDLGIFRNRDATVSDIFEVKPGGTVEVNLESAPLRIAEPL